MSSSPQDFMHRVFSSWFSIPILLIFITFLTYASSFTNPFIWDDEQFIYKNQFVTSFSVSQLFTQSTTSGAGVPSSYYRPLISLSYAVDYALWRDWTPGYHFTNTFAHALAGVVLFLFLRSLGLSRYSGALVSLLFLLHPTQTEAVTYINSRGDSLYAFWTFIGLLSFSLLYQQKFPKVQFYDLSFIVGSRSLLLLSILSYLFSILSKEIGIASIGLFFLTAAALCVQTPQKQRARLPVGAALGGLALIATSYLLVRTRILGLATDLQASLEPSLYTESIWVRLHTFIRALYTYIRLLIFPYPLHMERTTPILENTVSMWLFGFVLIACVLLALGLYEYRKKNTAFILFGASWFLGMLIPVSGIVPINGLIYEHWLYVPQVGCSLIVLGCGRLLKSSWCDWFLANVAPQVFSVIVLICIALTIRQNYLWADPVRFYRYTLSFSETARLHNNLAMHLADNGELSDAIIHYERSLSISNVYYQTYYNLGNAYFYLAEYTKAQAAYENALALEPTFALAEQRLELTRSVLQNTQE